MNDLFDIKANHLVRCLIETDRKKEGLDYTHDYSIDFIQQLKKQIYDFNKEYFFNTNLITEYYLNDLKIYHDYV